MRAICVDDEDILVEEIAEMCLELPEIDQVESFLNAEDALDWLTDHPVDLAILDIELPEMNGIALAAAIKSIHPKTAILFLTAYPQYALEAFGVRALGYLIKPVLKEDLASDVTYALSLCGKKKRLSGHVVVKTFGHFDIFVDDDPDSFRLAKSKEILAYLVDKQGSGSTRAEICAAIWEDTPYDRGMQKKLDVYIRSLRETLRDYGVEEIMEMKRGILRVRPDTFTCDAYLFFSGDSDMINTYRGEYMTSYSWASITEGILYWNSEDIP